jgi:outer membrane beta-barrel protein
VRKALVVFLLSLPTLAWAQIDELANPGSVSAVQDRRFRMGHELTLGVAVLPLDAFYKGVAAEIGYTAHFSDSFAWQVGRAAYSYNFNTGLSSQLERDFGVQPTAFDEVNWMVGSDLMWSPFYGKVSFLNQSVLHFEIFAIAGISVLRLSLASNSGTSILGIAGSLRPAANLGLGLRFFASRSLSWRLDVTNNVVFSDKIFNVPLIQLSAAINFGGGE